MWHKLKPFFEHQKKNLKWTEEYKINQSDTLLVQKAGLENWGFSQPTS